MHAQALERNEIMDAAHSEEFIRLFYQFLDQVGRKHPPLEWYDCCAASGRVDAYFRMGPH